MNRPAPSEPEDKAPQGQVLQGQVLPFRPRGSLFARNTQTAGHAPRPPAVPDLEKYERAANEPDDFRHRMLMNVLGLGFTVALVGGGLWIADFMAHMRKDQDCGLMGRPGCTPVDAPVRSR